MNRFGKNVKFLLNNPRSVDAPKTQYELADIACVSSSTVSRMLNNNNIKLEDALKICKVFNIPIQIMIHADLSEIDNNVKANDMTTVFVNRLIDLTKKGSIAWTECNCVELANEQQKELKNIMILYEVGNDEEPVLLPKERALSLGYESNTFFSCYCYISSGRKIRVVVTDSYMSSLNDDINLYLLFGISYYSGSDVCLLVIQYPDCEQVIVEKYDNDCNMSATVFDELSNLVKNFNYPLRVNFKTKNIMKKLINGSGKGK